jgi:hypothetical protein
MIDDKAAQRCVVFAPLPSLRSRLFLSKSFDNTSLDLSEEGCLSGRGWLLPSGELRGWKASSLREGRKHPRKRALLNPLNHGPGLGSGLPLFRRRAGRMRQHADMVHQGLLDQVRLDRQLERRASRGRERRVEFGGPGGAGGSAGGGGGGGGEGGSQAPEAGRERALASPKQAAAAAWQEAGDEAALARAMDR